MNLRFIDWIWCIRGSLPLSRELSTNEVFERLDSLLQAPGTTYSRDDKKISFQKKNQQAQDKMSIFDAGIFSVENRVEGRRLSYDLMSRTLLLCFLAPALFFGFAKTFEFTRDHQKLSLVPATISGASNDFTKTDTTVPLNSIDKFLGVPEPEKADKSKEDKEKKIEKKFSPTAAYVFCGVFVFLYAVGRILEQYLIRRELINIMGAEVNALFVFC